MRNLACGAQLILLVVTWLVLRRIERLGLRKVVTDR